MRALSRLLYTLRALLNRRRVDAELDEEMAFHLEREAAMLERAGMSPRAARREAGRRFGGVLRYREESQDVRRLAWLDDLGTDARFALRLFRRHPGFSLNVVGIAALGIAACATTASLVSGILLSPLPFAGADGVAMLHLRSASGRSSAALAPELYHAVGRGQSAIEAIAAFSPDGGAVDWNGEPERIRTELVTASFFRVFRLSLPIGRPFTDEEERERAAVALLGHELWRTRFNADSTVLGRVLILDDKPITIIGVMPPRFRAHLTNEPALWMPLYVTRAASSDRRDAVNAIVRVSDTLELARAEAWLATVISGRMEDDTRRDSVSARPLLVPISEQIYGHVRRPLLILLGAVLLVLLLVAANVGTMLLARSSAREQELAMRRALGASRSRQRRQLVTEALLLTGIGGTLGVLASYWIIAGIRGLGLRVLPRMDAVALDWRVLGFAVAATIVTGVVGGLAPALVSSAENASPTESGTPRVTRHRTSTALVVAQIALSLVLLVGGGLLMKSFLRILPDDPGFAVENRAILAVALRGPPIFPDTDRVSTRRFVASVSERMRQVRGVRDVAAMSFAPFFGSVSIAGIEVPGRAQPERPFTAYSNLITANYFDVMQIAVARGRSFAASDVEGAPLVAVVNETAASRWWPGENPIGRAVNVTRGREPFSVTVVGVSGDTRLFGTDTRFRPEIYLPAEQHDPRFVTFIAHTQTDPPVIMRQLQRAVWSVAPRLPIGTSSDLAAIASDSVRRQRFFSVAITLFAAASIVLTALGIYGLLAFAVVQRRREIGIRIAIGASARSVAALVMRRAILMGASGIAIGTVLAVWLSKYLEALLIEVSARDGQVFGAASTGVLVVALLAACAPVIQAVRVDPIESLRS